MDVLNFRNTSNLHKKYWRNVAGAMAVGGSVPRDARRVGGSAPRNGERTIGEPVPLPEQEPDVSEGGLGGNAGETPPVGDTLVDVGSFEQDPISSVVSIGGDEPAGGSSVGGGNIGGGISSGHSILIGGGGNLWGGGGEIPTPLGELGGDEPTNGSDVGGSNVGGGVSQISISIDNPPNSGVVIPSYIGGGGAYDEDLKKEGDDEGSNDIISGLPSNDSPIAMTGSTVGSVGGGGGSSKPKPKAKKKKSSLLLILAAAVGGYFMIS